MRIIVFAIISMTLCGCASKQTAAQCAQSMAGTGLVAVVNPCAGIGIAVNSILHAGGISPKAIRERNREREFNEYMARAADEIRENAMAAQEKQIIENMERLKEWEAMVATENERRGAANRARIMAENEKPGTIGDKTEKLAVLGDMDKASVIMEK